MPKHSDMPRSDAADKHFSRAVELARTKLKNAPNHEQILDDGAEFEEYKKTYLNDVQDLRDRYRKGRLGAQSLLQTIGGEDYGGKQLGDESPGNVIAEIRMELQDAAAAIMEKGLRKK